MKRWPMRRFIDEVVLYSSQFIAFFILLLFLIPSVDALKPITLFIALYFLILQIILLANQGHLAILRIIFSLISPAGYTLIRQVTGTFRWTEMANIFIWSAAIYVAIFQTIALSSKAKWLKGIAEFFLAMGAVLVMIFLYYYLDLRFYITQQLNSGQIDMQSYVSRLDIMSFKDSMEVFASKSQNWFLMFGTATFGVMLLSSKVLILQYRARIASILHYSIRPKENKNENINSTELSEGLEKTVTVISSDIRDFTNFAQKLGAKNSVSVLNRYYSLWAAIANKQGGRVIEFAGDSVIIAFGLDNEANPAEQALFSAKEFLKEYEELKNDLNSSALPAPIEVSIGIHSGNVVVGELGFGDMQKIRIFGEAVSVASRLDSLCREFKQSLLLSQTIVVQLGLDSQEKLIKIGDVLVRNTTTPLPVYSLK